MGQLVVTRRRRWTLPDLFPLQVVIDEERATPIKQGQTIAIDLPHGRHEISGLMGSLTSEPIELELGAAGHQHFEVGVRFGDVSDYIVGLAPLLFVYAIISTPDFPKTPALLIGWFVMMGLLFLYGHVRPAQRGKLCLYIKHVGESDCSASEAGVACHVMLQHSDLRPLPQLQPGFRLSIRGSMVLVAVVALFLWLGVGRFRAFRTEEHWSKARMHTEAEKNWRKEEQAHREMQMVERVKKSPQAVGIHQSSAAKAAASADYHRAMRQKYERAASLGILTVDPDPPEPPAP